MLSGKRAEQFLTDVLKVLTRYEIRISALSFADPEGVVMKATFKDGNCRLERTGRVETSSIVLPH